MLVTVIGPNLIGQDHEFHVHAKGCRDCGQPKYHREDKYDMDADCHEDVVETIYGDIMDENDEPWSTYANEFKFFPCCDLADIRT